MPVVVLSQPDDEIADLIERIRSARDPEVGLVLPKGSRALQTPLNARLLSQFSRQNGRRTAIVSEDPRIQQLARSNGFSVYASVAAFERGIEAISPAAVGAGALSAGTSAAAATALRDAPPRTGLDDTAPAGIAAQPVPPRRALPPVVPLKTKGGDNRRPLYYIAAAVGVVGLLLFFTLAPSAKITVGLLGTQLSVNPTIQGSTVAPAAGQNDRLTTALLQSMSMSNFQASPTGQKTVPAANATGTEIVSTTYPNGIQGTLPKGDAFQTSDHSLTFVVTQDTYVCVGPNGQTPPTGCSNNGHPAQPNSAIPIQDQTAEAKGNVPAGSITYWPPDQQPNLCRPQPPANQDLCSATNPQATTAGADQKQLTVASAQDVSSWSTQVTQIENNLTNQINGDLQSKAGGKTFAVDPAGHGKSIAFAVSPQLPNAGDQFAATMVTITATGKAAAYNPADVQADLMADLNAQVSQGDELAPGKFSAQPCTVTQAGDDGTVVLSCTATDFSQPIIDLQGLKGELTGKNPGDAQKIIESHIDKVQTVSVSEFPFRLFYLPLFSSRIEIDENFVTQSSATP